MIAMQGRLVRPFATPRCPVLESIFSNVLGRLGGVAPK
jgi:hypothetical protein